MGTTRNLPTTIGEARVMLGGRDERTIANNTRLRRNDDGTVSMVLHSTPVVTWDDAGYITLDTGGWESVTTKQRMNAVLRSHGYSIGAVRRVWYVFDHWNRDERGNFARYAYCDGDAWPTIHADSSRARLPR